MCIESNKLIGPNHIFVKLLKQIFKKMAAKQTKQQSPKAIQPKVVSESRGKGSVMSDGSFKYQPYNDTGECLYTDFVNKTKQGELKGSEKTYVMTIKVSKGVADPGAELYRATLDLIKPMMTKIEDETQGIPIAECIGHTAHTTVCLEGEVLVVKSRIGLKEQDSKMAKLAESATPEQLKYISLYLDPCRIYQGEVAQVSALINLGRKKAQELAKKTSRKSINNKKDN